MVFVFGFLRLLGDPCFTPSCCPVWKQSFGLHHQPSREEFRPPHRGFPLKVCILVSLRAQQVFQERSERMEAESFYLRSPESLSSLARATRSFMVDLFNILNKEMSVHLVIQGLLLTISDGNKSLVE